MGTSARSLDINVRVVGVDAVRSGMRAVRDEANSVGSSTTAVSSGFREAAREAKGLNETAVYGLGEVSRGITNLGMAGHVTSMSVRELSGGVMRLGSLLGPAAGLAGIAVMAAGLIMEVFQKMRSGMSDTEKQFTESIGRMANAGQSADLQKKYREIYFGTPYDDKGNLRNPSAVPGAFEGSLVALRSRMAFLQDKLAHPEGQNLLEQSVFVRKIQSGIDLIRPQLDAAEAQARKIQTAIDLIQNQPASMGILPMKSTAMSSAAALRDAAKAEAALLKDGAEALKAARKAIPIEDPLFPTNDSEPAVDRARKLAELVKRYNPAVDHSADRKALEASTRGLYATKPRAADITAAMKGSLAGAQEAVIAEFQKEVQEPLARTMRDGLASTIGSSISDGIMAGFESHSITAGFKAAGKAVLAGIGGIFEQMGGTWIQYGILMTSLGEALWNPFTSGPAAIGIGVALTALGAALGGIAHGSSRSSGATAITSMPALVNTGFINSTSPATRGAAVTPKSATINNINLLGDDPASVRKLQEMLDRNAKLSAA